MQTYGREKAMRKPFTALTILAAVLCFPSIASGQGQLTAQTSYTNNNRSTAGTHDFTVALQDVDPEDDNAIDNDLFSNVIRRWTPAPGHTLLGFGPESVHQVNAVSNGLSACLAREDPVSAPNYSQRHRHYTRCQGPGTYYQESAVTETLPVNSVWNLPAGTHSAFGGAVTRSISIDRRTMTITIQVPFPLEQDEVQVIEPDGPAAPFDPSANSPQQATDWLFWFNIRNPGVGVNNPPRATTLIAFKRGPHVSITLRCEAYSRNHNGTPPRDVSSTYHPPANRNCRTTANGLANERSVGSTHWIDAFLNDEDDFWIEGFPRGNSACWTNIVDGGEHDGKDRLQCRNTIGQDPPGGQNFLGRGTARP